MTGIQGGDTLAPTPFEQQVKRALRWFDDPERLGQESPLASPYFLGRALRDLPRPVQASDRGQVLRDQLRVAARRLWAGPLPASREELLEQIPLIRRDPDDPRYAYLVLELRVLHEYITPYRTSDIWEQPHLLLGSKSQHYRDFDAAVKRLAAQLIDALRPALRPERPRAPAALYEYEQQLAQLGEALATPQTITLVGPAGVGKTSSAATALERVGAQHVFWYTLRPGFNDGVHSLLFALGAFLLERGAPNLWQYLVTTNGSAGDLHLAAGLLREDLALLAGCRPILCFDDLEHLTTAGLDMAAPQHMQLLQLIEGLCGTATLLLISQRPILAGDLLLELRGLSSAGVEQLWRGAGHELTHERAKRLHTYTTGNPRLLTLLLMLWHEEEELLLGAGTALLSLWPAFERLWRRLTPAERRALQRLSVYQGYVPEEVLPGELSESLARMGLIVHDGEGGISLPPALAPAVFEGLSPELREQLHREAALVRLERGEQTAAAYHFVQSNQEQRAVQVWFPQRKAALAHGEADAARRVFSTISRERLDQTERTALDIIRTELYQLAGDSGTGLRELEQADWSAESEANVQLWMLRGDLEDALGYPDQALTSYSAGLDVTARLLSRLAGLHYRRGSLFVRRRNMAACWHEIQRTEYELQVLRGVALKEQGEYSASIEAMLHARTIANQLEDDALRARAESKISSVYGRLQQSEQAIGHALAALSIYERMGDRHNVEKMRSNLAFIYVQARQYALALEVGTPAYEFFVSVRDPFFASVTAANLAEAAYELGQLELALHHAGEVLGLGNAFATPYAHFTLGQVALARRNPAQAAEHMRISTTLAQQNDDLFLAAYALRGLGQAYLAAAEPAAAEQPVRDALALFRQLELAGEIDTTQSLLDTLYASAPGAA